MIPSQISGRFEVGELIAKGAFARVYEATCKTTKERVALKIVDVCDTANVEPTLLSSRPDHLAVPRLYYHQVVGTQVITALELLGLSVYSLMQYRNAPLPVSLVVKMTHDVAKVLQWLHRKGYIHRDVKPDNIVMGRGDNSEKAYLIDYSEAKKYKKVSDSQQVGNPYFLSLNVLKGGAEGPKDDIESLLTTALYLLTGDLPWMHIVEMDEDRLQTLVADKKTHTRLDSLCADAPPCFLTIFEHVRSLQGVDLPDYHMIFELLREAEKNAVQVSPQLAVDRSSFRSLETAEEPYHSARRNLSMHNHSGTPGPTRRLHARRHTTASHRHKPSVNSEAIPTVITHCGPRLTAKLRSALRALHCDIVANQ